MLCFWVKAELFTSLRNVELQQGPGALWGCRDWHKTSVQSPRWTPATGRRGPSSGQGWG